MKKQFQNHSKDYPYLLLELMLYFKMSSANGKMDKKTVMDFCSFYQKKYSTQNLPQPAVVVRICETLVSKGMISVIHRDGPDGFNNQYLAVLRDKKWESDNSFQKSNNFMLSCLCYGFPYIYEQSRPAIFSVISKSKTDEHKLHVGTSFGFCGFYIVTAKHCLVDGKEISIEGFSSQDLNSAKIRIHKNPNVDIAVLKFDKPVVQNSIPAYAEASVLDEVITMGFPQIPGFYDVIVGEKADISSRFTMTKGAIASQADNIWAKESLFLITAKIKGGNSGGPVINNHGAVIGVAVQEPLAEGDYDDLGYGVVIPMDFVAKTIINGSDFVELNDVVFSDYPDFG